MSELIVFTDGASSGNPGPGWAMWVIANSNDKLQMTNNRVKLEHCTNNEAEYLAVIHALKHLLENSTLTEQYDSILFKLDSKLVVEQVAGRWKIKDARMREFVKQTHELRSKLPIPAHFTHIPREQNLADALKYDA